MFIRAFYIILIQMINEFGYQLLLWRIFSNSILGSLGIHFSLSVWRIWIKNPQVRKLATETDSRRFPLYSNLNRTLRASCGQSCLKAEPGLPASSWPELHSPRPSCAIVSMLSYFLGPSSYLNSSFSLRTLVYIIPAFYLRPSFYARPSVYTILSFYLR